MSARKRNKKKKRRKLRRLLILITMIMSTLTIGTVLFNKINEIDEKKDNEPPKIEYAEDQTVYIGDTVSYKKDVIVTDNMDESVDLAIDSSAVNLKKSGSYSVIYKATDSSGNTETKTVIITVKERPEDSATKEELDDLADDVLASIIHEGMSKREKAKAIYNWTRSSITYIDYSDKSDVIKAAIEGIKKRSGDCFVYFATAQELLTRADIENQGILKLGGGHYWSLVNIGDGWYHFDTTPRVGDGDYFFMLTDAQIEEYSNNNNNSHVWDKTKYPATPLE